MPIYVGCLIIYIPNSFNVYQQKTKIGTERKKENKNNDEKTTKNGVD